MRVEDIMSRDPVHCGPDATLLEVAVKMVEFDCGEIPICDDAGKPVGVITDRDIVTRAVAKGKNPASVTAAECMSEPVVVVKQDTTLEDVLAVMEENQIRRVPVVDESGCCCGIISQADVALCAGENKAGELVREVSKGSVGVH